jgi:putative ABC transport system permease protein
MRRILRYFRLGRFERDLDAELQGHLDEMTEELIRWGRTPEEARMEAVRRFGNRVQVAESSRERWAFGSLDQSMQDLRYAIRSLRKKPLFSAVAVLSLSLGIGANTAIFSAINQVLLRPLPYPRAERLLAVWSRTAAHGSEPMFVSAADYYDWRAQSHSFEGLAAYASWPMNLTNVDEPRRLDSELVSADFFSVMGVHAAMGRTFLPDEDQEKSPFVVVISHHLWRALGGSAEVLGRQITLNGSQATVVGVMPESFVFPTSEVEAWVAMSLSAQSRSNREGRWLAVVGRLKANSSQREASTEMEVISRRLAAAYPASNTGWSLALVSLQEELVGKIRPILVTLQAGSLLLLLITCTNLANMLLANGASRSREITVRAALGASRSRILRLLFVESSVLAVLGGGLGMALGVEGIYLVRTFGAGFIPRAAEIHLSTEVAAFVVAATLITAIIFGFIPALNVSRADLAGQIRSGGRGTPRHVEHKRGLLISIEVGLALVLLIGGGLLSKSLTRLLTVPPGLSTDHLLTMRLTLSHSAYSTNAEQLRFFDRVLGSVRDVPGVVAVGEISDTPLKGNNPTFEFVIDGLARRPSDPPIQAGMRAISTGYLKAAGIPVLKGRDFTIHDDTAAGPVAIVNQAMARRYWPSGAPIGRRLRFKDEQDWISVVGVVPDVKQLGLANEEGSAVYIPYAQKTQNWLAWTTIVARTAGDPGSFAPAIRHAIRSIDQNQPIAEIGTLDEVLAHYTAMPRFTTAVIAALSGFALLIAIVGVYGLLAYTVAQRMPEFGIRVALGASSRQVSWLLLRQAMTCVFTGIIGGLLGAWWFARLLGSILFEVRAHDPLVFAGSAGLLIAVTLIATWFPVRSASEIDPMTALRSE